MSRLIGVGVAISKVNANIGEAEIGTAAGRRQSCRGHPSGPSGYDQRLAPERDAPWVANRQTHRYLGGTGRL